MIRAGAFSSGSRGARLSPATGSCYFCRPAPLAAPMPTPPPRRLSQVLADVCAAYQAADVIPYCPVCAKPCCKLDKLVLELEWKQVKVLWKLDESRSAFDRRLAAGRGPQEIRAADGLYFAHQKPCPAYDDAAHNCRIYGQDLKPVGCSDFPVYEDDGVVVADLRCEAVDLAALVARLGEALGPEWQVVQTPDRDFPFLVTLSVRRKRSPQPAPPAKKPKR